MSNVSEPADALRGDAEETTWCAEERLGLRRVRDGEYRSCQSGSTCTQGLAPAIGLWLRLEASRSALAGNGVHEGWRCNADRVCRAERALSARRDHVTLARA